MRQLKFDRRCAIGYISTNGTLESIITSYIDNWKRRSKSSSKRIVFISDVIFKKGTVDETVEYIKSCEKLIGLIPVTFIIVRNNNTDPALFKDIMELGNIVLVPDYTVISIGTINILCIGGRITPNRSWKINNINRKNVVFFEDEGPVFNEDAIHEICEDKSMMINMVVSSTPLTYVGDNVENIVGSWVEKDKALINDIFTARSIMDEIMMHLRKASKTPSVWCIPHSTSMFDIVNIGNTTYISSIQSLDDVRNYITMDNVSHRRRRRKANSFNDDLVMIDEPGDAYQIEEPREPETIEEMPHPNFNLEHITGPFIDSSTTDGRAINGPNIVTYTTDLGAMINDYQAVLASAPQVNGRLTANDYYRVNIATNAVNEQH